MDLLLPLYRLLQLINPVADAIQVIFIILAGLFALHEYMKNERFQRAQTLSALWDKFVNDADMVDIFSAFDNPADAKDKLLSVPNKAKLRYLGILEDVVHFYDLGEIDKKRAIYMFQWHFYFVFYSENRADFWQSLGGIEEAEKPYWKQSRNFAEQCRKEISPCLQS